MLATLIGLVVAWELRTTTSKWKRAALWLATLFPLWTSVVVRNYAFTILLQRKGILNTALVSTGIIDEPLSILYTDVAVVLGMLYTMLPYRHPAHLRQPGEPGYVHRQRRREPGRQPPPRRPRCRVAA